MKKPCLLLLLCFLIVVLAITTFACSENVINFKLNFDVDGTIIKTVDTSGKETISLPSDPEKDGFVFDGWYWDKDTWLKPFTANSLLDAPLSSNMTVYAKWSENTHSEDPASEQNPEEKPAHTHQYGEWKIVTPATCTTAGLQKKTCACGEDDITEVIPAKGHTEVIDTAVAATCTQAGLTEGKHCAVCETVLVKQEETDALGHDYSEWAPYTAATCTAKGEDRRNCSRCESYEFRATEIDPDNHNIVHHDAQAVSCTVVGWSAYDTCSRCSYTTYEVIPALGHDYNSITTPPTCTAEGYTTHTCSRCKDSYIDTLIAAKGHTEVIDAAVPATCTQTGITEGKHCSECGFVLLKQEITEINPSNHLFGNNNICLLCGENKGTRGLLYSLTQNKVSVVGYDGSDDEIIIPSHYNGYPITSIMSEAFMENSEIKTIYIPSTVTYISSKAFAGCSSLEELTFPCDNFSFLNFFGSNEFENSIKIINRTRTYYVPKSLKKITITNGTIPNECFKFCSSLETIEICEGVTSIGDYALDGCSNLKTITIPSSLKSIGKNNRFGQEGTGKINPSEIHFLGDIGEWCEISGLDSFMISNVRKLYISGEIVCGNISIPEGVTEIKDCAFAFCSGITSIVFPESLESIGERAFYECYLIKSITLPDRLTSIGKYAFSFYHSVTVSSLTLPASLIQVHDEAFAGTQIKEIYYRGTILDWCSMSDLGGITADVQTDIYVNGESIEHSVIIPEEVVSIPRAAFLNRNSLQTVVILGSLSKIGEYAFWMCRQLKSISLPDGVKTIESGAFSHSGLRSITIPSSVTSIGTEAFRNTELYSITFCGTKKQWNEIVKGKDWDLNTSVYTIHCTDGDIKKS